VDILATLDPPDTRATLDSRVLLDTADIPDNRGIRGTPGIVGSPDRLGIVVSQVHQDIPDTRGVGLVVTADILGKVDSRDFLVFQGTVVLVVPQGIPVSLDLVGIRDIRVRG
jgi:hypothetical protein